jgi:hypothetical protein
MRRTHTLPILMILYGAASLLHFMHNAVYLHEYPNLPEWITAFGVYASWCGIAALGALGYWLYREVSQVMGVVVIAIYALPGFGGLDHYVLAPIGAHSIVMNATIIGEATAAAALLIFLAHSVLSAHFPAGQRREGS